MQPNSRYELAQWLVHPDNPLTARVAVNRFWQQLFGRGLVESSENFGSQGTLPSHPQLLDYLASEFIHAGWDTKALIKQILLSATYQQSSDALTHLIERDPKNELLGARPRMRLSGFALRDQALVASGLYVEGVGGPSVRPYMPPRIWRSISNNSYKQDTGDKLYRRSLYTYWRRTIPPPTMMNFNAAAREVCIVRTEQTNTPLQALTLLNNKIFVESCSKSCRAIYQPRWRHDHRTTSVRFPNGIDQATNRARIGNPARFARVLSDPLYRENFSESCFPDRRR